MIDARLLGPALGAWGGAALAFLVAGTPGDGGSARDRVSLCVLALGGIGVIALAVSGSRRRLVAAAVLGVVLGAGAAAIHVHRVASPQVQEFVARQGAVTAVVVVESDPQRRDPKPGSWAPARLEVRAHTILVTRGATRVTITVPVVLRGTLQTAFPPPGSTATVSGRGRPSLRWDSSATITVAADPVVVGPPGFVDGVANAMRGGLRAALRGDRLPGAALVGGLAVGDEFLQDRELTSAMRSTGLAHLTAVSGGNVAIVLSVVLALAVLLRWRIATRVVVGLLCLGFFVVLVRPEPSVVRAAVMGAVVVLSMLTGGRRRGPTVLAAAILAVVIVSPALAVSWGFGLSTCATAGILLIAPVLVRRLETWQRTAAWPPALVEAIALTTAAQLATLPLLVAMGSAVGWVAIVANLLAMPAVPPVTVLGLAAALIAPVVPTVATVLAHLAAIPATWIALVAHRCAELPFSSLPLPAGWAGEIVLAGWIGLALLAYRLGRRFTLPPTARRLIGIGLATVLVLLVVAPPGRRGWPPPGWVMVMCDVGQGEAVVLRSSDGGAVVVDVGPVPDLVDRCLDDLGVRRVEAVVLTHFHADHAMGLAGIGRGRRVERAFVTTLDDPPEQAVDALRWFASVGVTPVRLQAGMPVDVGAMHARVLWPTRPVSGGSAPNNASIVLLAHVDGVRLLLTADVEREAQAVLERLGPVAVDAATVPHHGSANQDAGFAGWVRARVGLVSVGAGNDYGHPSAATVRQWSRFGLVGRTDESGDLAVVRGADGALGLVAHRG